MKNEFTLLWIRFRSFWKFSLFLFISQCHPSCCLSDSRWRRIYVKPIPFFPWKKIQTKIYQWYLRDIIEVYFYRTQVRSESTHDSYYLTNWLIHWRPFWRWNELTLADGIKYQISKRCWCWNEVEVRLPTACNSCQCWQQFLSDPGPIIVYAWQ